MAIGPRLYKNEGKRGHSQYSLPEKMNVPFSFQTVRPDCVVEDESGLLMVDYVKLGVELSALSS
jgi:hypothetical protein